VSERPRGEEYEGGMAAPREGEQEESHESTETLSPDEIADETPPSDRD
jgi:hypothetical protein